MKNQDQLTTRREFLKTSAALGTALAAPAILPGNLFAGANRDTLRVGLIGCGGRGTGAAGQALSADKNVVLSALGDAFEERFQPCLSALRKDGVEKGYAERIKVTPDNC